MKKIYQKPILHIVKLNGGDICQMVVSSDPKKGTGPDLVKEDPLNPAAPHYDVWDDDWRDEEEKKDQQW